MRKPITIILALLIALSPVLAYAESMNLAALLAAEDNKNLGNETGVYNALYKVLIKAKATDPFRYCILLRHPKKQAVRSPPQHILVS